MPSQTLPVLVEQDLLCVTRSNDRTTPVAPITIPSIGAELHQLRCNGSFLRRTSEQAACAARARPVCGRRESSTPPRRGGRPRRSTTPRTEGRRPPGPGRRSHPGAAGRRRPRTPAGRDAVAVGGPHDGPRRRGCARRRTSTGSPTSPGKPTPAAAPSPTGDRVPRPATRAASSSTSRPAPSTDRAVDRARGRDRQEQGGGIRPAERVTKSPSHLQGRDRPRS